MKCDNYQALYTEGFEYPEYYCGACIHEKSMVDFKDGADGRKCSLKQIKKLLTALVRKAKEKTDTRKEETPTINGEIFLTLRVEFNDMKTEGAATKNGKIVIDDHDLLFDDILHNLGGAAQITEISSEVISS